jgi:hypothetical protein
VDERSEMQNRNSGAEKNFDTGRDPKQSGNLHLPILWDGHKAFNLFYKHRQSQYHLAANAAEIQTSV